MKLIIGKNGNANGQIWSRIDTGVIRAKNHYPSAISIINVVSRVIYSLKFGLEVRIR